MTKAMVTRRKRTSSSSSSRPSCSCGTFCWVREPRRRRSKAAKFEVLRRDEHGARTRTLAGVAARGMATDIPQPAYVDTDRRQGAPGPYAEDQPLVERSAVRQFARLNHISHSIQPGSIPD